MKQEFFTITQNIKIAPGVYKMTLSGHTFGELRPGRFINIRLPGFYLRRPISICDYDDSQIVIIYKTVGAGTQALSEMQPGESLDVLIGLGNGFDLSKSGKRPVVIGGGAGVPPMYALAKELISHGKKVTAILGFNKKEEIFYREEFESLGAKTLVSTVDGSFGVKGFVTDALSEIPDYTYVYSCGPLPMLKAVYENSSTQGQFSFEERMGCGFGACMGCSCKTKNGSKRVCKEGPVFFKEEIIW